MGEGNYGDYLCAIHDPAVQTAMIEDYRAGLGVDRAADDADRTAGRQLACPTLVVWSTKDDLETLYGDAGSPGRPTGTVCPSAVVTTWPKTPPRTSPQL